MGLPICEWAFDKPSQDRVDQELDFSVYIGEKSFSVAIGEPFELKRLIVAERVKFGVDIDENLCAVQVMDLVESEMENIRLAFPSNNC